MKHVKKLLLVGSSTVVCLLYTSVVYLSKECSTCVTIVKTDTFVVPASCKRLALMGSTPHPSKYLAAHNDHNAFDLVKKIDLKDFLDLDYMIDSLKRTLILCKEHHADHLIIAYLPVYFKTLKQKYGSKTVALLESFLDRITPQVEKMIEEIMRAEKLYIPITLVRPTHDALTKIPTSTTTQEYARYLVKQLPLLQYNTLETIMIINNSKDKDDDADQSDCIIDYLRYEYLFNKPLSFEKYETGKTTFHRYL